MLRFCAVLALLTAAAPFFAEGAQRFRIDAVAIEGLPDDPPVPDAVLLSFPLYYDRSSEVGRSVYAISKILSDGGYPYNSVWQSITVNSVDDRDSVVSISLRFRIDPGERVCMGKPLIIASNKRPGIYYRDVIFTPNTPYNAAAVDESVKRLSARPYVKSAAAASPVIIEDAPKCRDSMPVAVAAISVTDRRGMEAEGALGYESERGGGLSGRLTLSFVNMLRRGESVDLSYVGTQTVQRLKSAATYPWAFDLPFELGGSLGAEIEDGGYGYLGGDISASVDIGTRLRCGVSLAASETVPPDSIGTPYTFYGADVFLELKRAQWERGAYVPEFSVKTGGGAARREKSYARNKAEAAAGIHYPISENYAVAGRVCAKSLFTEEEYLPPAELYRTGGHGSLRGYSEDEYAFRSVAFSQIELLYYFDRAGSVYIFTDGGAGFNVNDMNRLSMANAEKLLGYGIGLRFPSRLGTVSLEWARNVADGKSLGRVHVGVRTGI
ncbi:MAG: BamA/TamA family outer membrane protein [Chitinispirillales bacterium]|jgi:outer membrane protein assembly factor BamA|nr:BamA/TamA family outer membrane protein [Chitinispirillales bacterium]